MFFLRLISFCLFVLSSHVLYQHQIIRCACAVPGWKACFLRACRAWRAPGPWLGCGVACLRLEQWEEAEDALQHASRLDCNSPLVWGHLALLLLSMGEDRCEEHVIPVQQALCVEFPEFSQPLPAPRPPTIMLLPTCACQPPCVTTLLCC